MSEVAVIELPAEPHWGPAMSALPNDSWRRFAIACCQPTATGETDYTQAAREAGFEQSDGALRVTAHRMAHDIRIQEAILEIGRRNLGAGVALATATIIQVMITSTKNETKLKAAGMLLNRGGLPEKTEHNVTVERTFSEQEQIERAILLADKLGLDPAALLGQVGLSMPKRITNSAMAETIVDAEVVDPGEHDAYNWIAE